jgi:hypothetical protein
MRLANMGVAIALIAVSVRLVTEVAFSHLPLLAFLTAHMIPLL